MIIEESGLKFIFENESKAIKYDDSNFYRNYVNRLPSAKGVDFMSIQAGRLVLTEVKTVRDMKPMLIGVSGLIIKKEIHPILQFIQQEETALI